VTVDWLGLRLDGDIPTSAVPVAAVTVVEVIDDDSPRGRSLYVLASDMPTWTQVGMLVVAADMARAASRDDWESDEP
jgi:hypothetical protein